MIERTPQVPQPESEASKRPDFERRELGRIGMMSVDRLSEMGPSTIGDPQSEAMSTAQKEALRNGISIDQVENPEEYPTSRPKPHQQLGMPNKPTYFIPERHGKAGQR